MPVLWRKKLCKPFALLLCAALTVGLFPLQAGAVTRVTANMRPDITIVIDGSKRSFFNVNGQQVHPILYQGTTYLPVRAIGELMGKNVDWNGDTKTATLSGPRTAPTTTGVPDPQAKVQPVDLSVRDDFTIVVDGVVRKFADVNGNTVYPVLYQGSTYLPVRAIGELMGKKVQWDGTTQTATLSEDDDLVTDADSFSGTGVSLLSAEEAKAKALVHAGLSAGQVTFSKQKLHREEGRWVYEIEFFAQNQCEYEYEIDAATGAVLSMECEKEHGSFPTEISSDQARDIALAKVPGAASHHVTCLELESHSHGHCYQVEILYGDREYACEIDAITGNVREFHWDYCHQDGDHYSGGHHSGSHHGC